jgi:HSP20 family protein
MLILRNPRTFDPFDRIFDQLTSGWSTTAPRRDRTPSVHGEWHDDSLVLTIDLPGVPAEAVKVEVADRALTVSVEHLTDRGEFRWAHTVQMGGSLDAERVAARYADGRLTVTIPPVPTAAPRPVAIEIVGRTDDAPAALDAPAEG